MSEEELRAEIDHLKEQLETRRQIDRAKALLMERGLTEKEAFTRMQKASMNTRRPLREIAEAVILSESVVSPGT